MLPEQDRFMEELHRKYFRKLTLYVMSVLRDSARAQDVVQDALHEALRNVNDLMRHENPGGWLMETVKNKVRDSERTHRRYMRRFLSLDTEISAELVSVDSSAAEVDESDDVVLMEKIEQLLTPEEYRLLKRLIFDKASHLETAQEFGITVYASQKRLERIREKLYREYPERRKKRK